MEESHWERKKAFRTNGRLSRPVPILEPLTNYTKHDESYLSTGSIQRSVNEQITRQALYSAEEARIPRDKEGKISFDTTQGQACDLGMTPKSYILTPPISLFSERHDLGGQSEIHQVSISIDALGDGMLLPMCATQQEWDTQIDALVRKIEQIRVEGRRLLVH